MLTCFNTWSTLSGGVDVPGFTPIPGACGECCWDIDVWEFGPELPPMPLPAGDKALVVDGIPPAADFDPITGEFFEMNHCVILYCKRQQLYACVIHSIGYELIRLFI